MKVLIVDDTATNLKLLHITLEEEGMAVFEAADGVEALQVLEREEVEAIISDILMPRMDGYRLCFEVRRSERHKNLPFLFYTNTYTSPGDEQLGLQLGAQAFLRKPAATEVILKALQQAISTPAGTPALPVEMHESDVLKEYSERLVAKLEEKNIALAAQTEELLQAKRQMQLQATALDAAANAILITDRTGAIQWVNPAFTRLTGYTAGEIIGKTPRLLKSGIHDRAFYKELWKTITSGKTWHGEFTNRRKDGTLFHDDHTITPVRSDRGEITHFVGILHDVTVRKQAEEELKCHVEELARSNAELTRFNRLTVGRELRMVELKQEVNRLSEELGSPAPYGLDFVPNVRPTMRKDLTAENGTSPDARE